MFVYVEGATYTAEEVREFIKAERRACADIAYRKAYSAEDAEEVFDAIMCRE